MSKNNHKIIPQDALDGWEPSQSRPLSGSQPFEGGMVHEMDSEGNHRIVSSEGVGGDWAVYNSIAVSPDGEYFAVTAYFEGLIPHETIIKMVPLAVE